MISRSFVNIFAIASLLPFTCNGQASILEIQIKTGDDRDAGSDNIGSSVDVSIVNTDSLSCVVNDIDNGQNDFQRDEINVFWGSDLDACENFYIPDQYIPILTLSHDGREDWTPEWVRVMLNDSSYLICFDGQEMNGDDSHNLECFPNVGSNVVSELQIKTADDDGAGFGAGSVDVDILVDLTQCSISRISSNDLNFQRDTIDVFWDSDLEDCNNFLLPDEFVPQVTLTHDGFDDWDPEWVRIVSADSTYLMCYFDMELDNNDSASANCQPYGTVA